MVRQIRREGDILKIKLKGGYVTYCRVLPEASFAFYDARTRRRTVDIEWVLERPILFIAPVYKQAVTMGRWERVGRTPLEAHLQRLPPKFIQDSMYPSGFAIYEDAKIRHATREECLGLECFAVWDPEHLEERIEDHYAGRRCKWLSDSEIEIMTGRKSD